MNSTLDDHAPLVRSTAELLNDIKKQIHSLSSSDREELRLFVERGVAQMNREIDEMSSSLESAPARFHGITKMLMEHKQRGLQFFRAVLDALPPQST